MDIDLVLFTAFSVIVLFDFVYGGIQAMFVANQSSIKRTRMFIRGIGYLMLTLAAFQFLWLLVIFGAFRGEFLRHFATGVFCVVDIIAVVARRRWWRNATNV